MYSIFIIYILYDSIVWCMVTVTGHGTIQSVKVYVWYQKIDSIYILAS